MPLHDTFTMLCNASPSHCVVRVQGIHGWFQLLDEERGLTENSAVPATVTKTEHGECAGVVGVALCAHVHVCVWFVLQWTAAW